MTQITNAELNAELLDDWVEWMRLRNLSPQTVLQYASLVRTWMAFLEGRDCRRVKPEDAADFARRPRGRRAHGAMGAPATRNRDMAILSSFYSWLVDRSELEKNPMRLAPRASVHNRKPKALPDETWLAAWDAANDIDRLWLGFGFFCGFRAAEIVNLRAEQVTDGAVVDFVRKGGHEDTWPLAEVMDDWRVRLPMLPCDEWETLVQVARKQGSSPVCDFIGYRVADSAKAALRYGDRALYSPTVLNKRLARVVKRAGCPPFSPHALRHSAITNWLRMGYPLHIVQVLAAHSSPEITTRYLAGSRRLLADWRSGNETVTQL